MQVPKVCRGKVAAAEKVISGAARFEVARSPRPARPRSFRPRNGRSCWPARLAVWVRNAPSRLAWRDQLVRGGRPPGCTATWPAARSDTSAPGQGRALPVTLRLLLHREGPFAGSWAAPSDLTAHPSCRASTATDECCSSGRRGSEPADSEDLRRLDLASDRSLPTPTAPSWPNSPEDTLFQSLRQLPSRRRTILSDPALSLPLHAVSCIATNRPTCPGSTRPRSYRVTGTTPTWSSSCSSLSRRK